MTHDIYSRGNWVLLTQGEENLTSICQGALSSVAKKSALLSLTQCSHLVSYKSQKLVNQQHIHINRANYRDSDSSMFIIIILGISSSNTKNIY